MRWGKQGNLQWRRFCKCGNVWSHYSLSLPISTALILSFQLGKLLIIQFFTLSLSPVTLKNDISSRFPSSDFGPSQLWKGRFADSEVSSESSFFRVSGTLFRAQNTTFQSRFVWKRLAPQGYIYIYYVIQPVLF